MYRYLAIRNPLFELVIGFYDRFFLATIFDFELSFNQLCIDENMRSQLLNFVRKQKMAWLYLGFNHAMFNSLMI